MKLLVNYPTEFFFLIMMAYAGQSAVTPEVRKLYKNLIEGRGLYSEDDKLVILNETNFKKTVIGANNSWLIEFYNSWCGYCHKFSPTWKAIGSDLVGWQSVIKLAVLDCSSDDNRPTCSEQDITVYPTMKFFPAYSNATDGFVSSTGVTTQSNVTKGIVRILSNEQRAGRGSHWPVLTPYTEQSISDIWNETSNDYIFFIFLNGSNLVANKVILDLSVMKNVGIKSVMSDNEGLINIFGVTNYPSLYVIEKSKTQPENLNVDDGSRTKIRLAIKSYLQGKGLTVPEEPAPSKNITAQVPSSKDLQEVIDLEDHLKKIKKLGDVIYLLDMEKALKYALDHEVASRNNISGEALNSLKNYLSVIAKYFPIHEDDRSFFTELHSSVVSKDEINGSSFRDLLSNTSTGLDSILSIKEDWMGCRGSESHLRGYPCATWMTFHYMTINALNNSSDPLEVLNAMLGYITHFFGCSDCSRHFQEMANESMRQNVTTKEGAVAWLWAAHNRVNNRLSKENEQDPEFLKIQFPSPERCTDCKDTENNWNLENVLKYLKSMYSRENINLTGSNSKLGRLSDITYSEFLAIDSSASLKSNILHLFILFYFVYNRILS